MGFTPRHWDDSGLPPELSYKGSFLLQSQLPYVQDPGTFRRVIPCAKAVNAQLAKYTVPIPTRLNPECWDAAQRMVLALFEDCRLFPISHLDVLVNPKAKAGFGFPETKAVAIRTHYSHLLSYLKRAHPDTTWTAMGKSEYLPLEKIRIGKQRNITFPAWDFDIRAKQYFQPFADWFVTHCKQWDCAYGTSNFFGEFHTLMSPMMDYRYHGKGDVTGMDRSHPYEAWLFLSKLFSSVFPPEYTVEIDALLHEMFFSKVHMPNGEIWILPRLKSGSPITTVINCIVKMLAIAYTYCRWLCYKNSFDPKVTPSWRSMRRHQYVPFYSDDHLWATSDPVLGSHAFRKECYADLGLSLKDEDAVEVSRVGFLDPRLTFLGASPKWVGGQYVPVYNGEKLLACFCSQTSVDMQKIASQLFSYIILTVFDDHYYQLFKRMFRDLKCHQYFHLWDRLTIRRFVSGSECFLSGLPDEIHDWMSPGQGRDMALKEILSARTRCSNECKPVQDSKL